MDFKKVHRKNRYSCRGGLSMRQLMDKKELVEYLNGKLRPDTLGRLVREGKIPVVKFCNIRRYFFEKEAIDRWVDNLQIDPQDHADIVQYEKHRKIQAV